MTSTDAYSEGCVCPDELYLHRKGVGWEDADLVRPVRIVQPTPEEASLPPD